ncbi:MAG: MarR family transcriptional regulator [Clostridia bacterium]|nr:MarR family transcriptional regulator [Clostridia bacterium]
MLMNEALSLYEKLRLMHYRSLFGRIHEKAGSLSATEAYSVDVIYILREPTIKQFSDFLGISQPNATYKINSLIEKGYIEKVPSDADRREYHLHIADKFYTYFDEKNAFMQQAVEKLRENHSPEELVLFEKMLHELNDAL